MSRPATPRSDTTGKSHSRESSSTNSQLEVTSPPRRFPVGRRSGSDSQSRGRQMVMRLPPPPDFEVAQRAKRRWEDMEEDDLRITPGGSVSTEVSSTASYTTRRKKHYVRNRKAAERKAAQLRVKPDFNHITVSLGSTFFRHYKAGFQFAEPDPYVAQFVEEHGVPDPCCDPSQVSFMVACDEAQMKHLRYFDRPTRGLNEKYRAAYNMALVTVRQLLALPVKLTFPSIDDLANVPYKKSKYPGVVYREQGFSTRHEAQEQALPDARAAWVQLMMGSVVDPHAVRLGGRGKSIMKSKEDVISAGDPKGRLILMLSQRDLLLCGVTEKLLTQAYLPDEYPLSVGMGWFKGNVTQFASRYVNFEKFFCFDAEKFDSSLDAYMVKDVIDILRSQFEGGCNEEYDAYWNFVLESLISAPIQRDDGWTMYKVCGTTSGHNHNTLVQCVCTLLIGYTALFALRPDLRPLDIIDACALESLGDDNLIAVLKLLRDLTVDDVADIVLDIFGINWGGDKSFATFSFGDAYVSPDSFTEEGAFQGIQYLGKYFRAERLSTATGFRTVAIPYRPVIETFTHMYYPERRGRSLHDTYQRAVGNLLDNYGNPLAAKWLNALLDWLTPQMETLPVTWDPEKVFDVAKDYTSNRVQVPKLQRWLYEEWLALTLAPVSAAVEYYETVDC